MKPREFFEAVAKMREHQRAYFRSNGRDKQELRYSKEMEAVIDREIARVRLLEKERMQPRLNL